MNYNNTEDMEILFFAFRYSLPPRTTERSCVLEKIMKDRDKIKKAWRKKMAGEARDCYSRMYSFRAESWYSTREELQYSMEIDVELMERFIRTI